MRLVGQHVLTDMQGFISHRIDAQRRYIEFPRQWKYIEPHERHIDDSIFFTQTAENRTSFDDLHLKKVLFCLQFIESTVIIVPLQR